MHQLTRYTATFVELAVWAAVFTLRADLTHFTWWGIIVYILFLIVYLADRHDRLVLFALVTEAVVVVGVIVMSLSRCSMLVQVAHDIGPSQYAAGNFIVHYLPTIGIVIRHKKPVRPFLQSACATALFSVYCTAKQPNAVYGCDIPYAVIVVGGTALFACITLVATAIELPQP